MEDSTLFSPLTLREVSLRNRIVVSPMLTYCAEGGRLNDYHFVHYGRFATGGAGLVFIESTKVDPRGCSTPRDLGLWKDDFIAPFRRSRTSSRARARCRAYRSATRAAKPVAPCPGRDACRSNSPPAWIMASSGS